MSVTTHPYAKSNGITEVWTPGHVSLKPITNVIFPAMISNILSPVDCPDEELGNLCVRFDLHTARRITAELNAVSLAELSAFRTTDQMILIEAGSPTHGGGWAPMFMIIEPDEMAEDGGEHVRCTPTDEGLYEIGSGWWNWKQALAPAAPVDMTEGLYNRTPARIDAARTLLEQGHRPDMTANGFVGCGFSRETALSIIEWTGVAPSLTLVGVTGPESEDPYGVDIAVFADTLNIFEHEGVADFCDMVGLMSESGVEPRVIVLGHHESHEGHGPHLVVELTMAEFDLYAEAVNIERLRRMRTDFDS